jgi:hypothetical protein
MDYDLRINTIKRKFIENMTTLYVKHKGLETKEAMVLYFTEMSDAINGRLPTDVNSDQFDSLVSEVWKGCIAGHKSNFYFGLPLVIKQASDVSRRFTDKKRSANRKFDAIDKSNQEVQVVKNCKTHPEEFGWTIENCHKWLADIDGMIARQEINVHVARSLQGMPRAALKRLGYVEPVVELPEFDAL